MASATSIHLPTPSRSKVRARMNGSEPSSDTNSHDHATDAKIVRIARSPSRVPCQSIAPRTPKMAAHAKITQPASPAPMNSTIAEMTRPGVIASKASPEMWATVDGRRREDSVKPSGLRRAARRSSIRAQLRHRCGHGDEASLSTGRSQRR